MNKIEKIRQEIERRKGYISVTHFAEELLSFLDTISEEPDKSLEEAAEKYAESIWKEMRYELVYDNLTECFKAGAEWQKEQDQPITGNSLEQEWLRYVDKKKKEYGGELPSLGEYGWLQIARHFAEWQKSQMMKDAVEGYVNYYEDSGGILMAEAQVGCPYHIGDKVKIIIIKDE